MAPHSSTLAWKIPWTEEPGRLQSMGSLRVGHNWVTSLSLFTFMHWRRKWQPTPVFLPGESQGWGSLWERMPIDGLPSMGSHRIGHDWSNLATAAAAAAVTGEMHLNHCRWLNISFKKITSVSWVPKSHNCSRDSCRMMEWEDAGQISTGIWHQLRFR